MVLNFEEVEILHKAHSTLLWSTNLASLLSPQGWDKFSMGVDLCKFCKESKCEKGEREDRGSCPLLVFKRVLNFEEVDRKWICMGWSSVPQPCFPPGSLEH